MRFIGFVLIILGAALLFGRPLGSAIDRARGAGM